MKILLLFILNSIYIEAGHTKNHKQNLFHPAIARDKEKLEDKPNSIIELRTQLNSLKKERSDIVQDTSKKLKILDSEIKKLEKRLK